MYKVAPEVLGEDFYNELDASFWATVVSKQTSNFLQEKGNSVDASIMLGTKGHYRCYYYKGELDHLELDFFLQYEADGSKSSYYDNEYHTRSPWGGTLESTYCQLAFDNATGWSRWMLLNEQEATLPESVPFYEDAKGKEQRPYYRWEDVKKFYLAKIAYWEDFKAHDDTPVEETPRRSFRQEINTSSN